MHCLGVSTRMLNTMANICRVMGTGPIGTVTHAETAMIATHKATNTSERVRDVVAVKG